MNNGLINLKNKKKHYLCRYVINFTMLISIIKFELFY